MRFCVAVGQRGTLLVDGPPLIETFNGARWTVTATPPITGTARLYGVSCPAVGICYAAGLRKNDGPEYGLVFRLTRGRWAKVKNPAHTRSHQQESLNAIACPATTRCLAVGYRNANPTTSQGATAAWRLLHGRWRVVNPPIQPDYRTADLRSVSCNTTTLCVAVGDLYTDEWHVNADVYNFSRWHYEQVPPAHDQAGLFSITCLRTTAWCFVLGFHTGGSLADIRN